MKLTLVEKVYAGLLLTIFGLIVLHAPLSVFGGTLFPAIDLLIKSWKEILMLLTLPMAVVSVSRRKLWMALAQDKLLQLVGLYVFLYAIISVSLLKGSIATLAGLAIDLRYIVFFVLVYVLLIVAPSYRHMFVKIGGIGAAVVVGFAALQLFLPADILSHIGYDENTIQPYLTVDKNPEFIRINSTLRGPNPLGAYAAIVLAVIAAAVARRKLVLGKNRITLTASLIAVGSIVALWLSYSRSAIAAALLAVGIIAITAFHQRLSRTWWIVGVAVCFALVGGLLASRENTFISNVIFHENPHGGSQVSSNEGHIESLVAGTTRLVRQPIGAGVGSTGSASLFTDSPLIIENQYLFIAHEVGWFGLGLFLALLIVLFTRLWRNRLDWLSLGVFASGIGLVFIGLVLPVWVDDTVSIIWWGLAAIALRTGGNDARQQTK